MEERLNECLANGTIPDPDLVEAIAVCKIKCIDVAIQRVHALRQEVGSYVRPMRQLVAPCIWHLGCAMSLCESSLVSVVLCRACHSRWCAL